MKEAIFDPLCARVYHLHSENRFARKERLAGLSLPNSTVNSALGLHNLRLIITIVKLERYQLACCCILLTKLSQPPFLQSMCSGWLVAQKRS